MPLGQRLVFPSLPWQEKGPTGANDPSVNMLRNTPRFADGKNPLITSFRVLSSKTKD